MEIKKTIIEILKDICRTEDITLDQNLKNDLGMDSLNIAELIVNLEEVFGIEFDINDLDPENFTITKDLVLLVEKYMEGRKSDL